MDKKYKVCQSCGMPIKKDKNKGTEKNGKLSNKYCVNCYKDGKFTQDVKSGEAMQKIVFEQLRKMHFPKFMAKIFTKKIPQLERWNKKSL